MSLAAQKRELQQLALQKSLIISVEYADAVESGKDVDRPGFQSLLRDLKSKNRTWTAILMYDTSRLGRRRYIAETFRHECKKLGVEIYFSKVPEVDPISQVILDSVLQAMDEVHSLMSREKGLAGMAENVRQGFRAGGRAPYGYRLVSVHTGQIRDGDPVTKSKLAPDPSTAPKITAWLKGRAGGSNGRLLADSLGISLSKSTLAHLEWSALTYAGNTVWNVHRGKEDVGQGRRRPRSEWVIQNNTHTPLITNDEAEAILSRLQHKKTVRDSRVRVTDYLLTGLLHTPDGAKWQGNSGNYRTGSSNIKSQSLEESVIAKIIQDFQTEEFVHLITEGARQRQTSPDDNQLKEMLTRIKSLDGKISGMTALLEETSAKRPLLKQIEEWEAERTAWASQYAEMKEEVEHAKVMAAIKESDIRLLLSSLAQDVMLIERNHQKEFLNAVLDKVVLDPKTRTGSISYKIAASGVKMASPRGFEPRLPP